MLMLLPEVPAALLERASAPGYIDAEMPLLPQLLCAVALGLRPPLHAAAAAAARTPEPRETTSGYTGTINCTSDSVHNVSTHLCGRCLCPDPV